VTNGEQVCSTSTSGDLYCVDAATGEPGFTQDVGATVTSPGLADDTLLVGVAVGTEMGVQAYSLGGDRLWSASVEVGAADQLGAVDGVVAVVDGLTAGELVGLDLATGEERWRAFTGDRAFVPTLVGGALTDGERFYVGMETYDGGGPTPESWVAAIDPATSEELWRAPLGLEFDGFFLGLSDLAFSDDGNTVTFVVAGDEGTDHLVALDTASGEVRWRAVVPGMESSVVQVGDRVLVAGGPDLTAYGPDGLEQWSVPNPIIRQDLSRTDPGELVHEGDHVYLVGEEVFEIDPATGAEEMVAEGVGAADVAVVDGLLVVSGTSSLEARPLAG
jgi:outer membrane protein assembly factor BamB